MTSSASLDRFSMASALVRRANAHKQWIGDDHGDPYEDAMLSGVVSDELQIVAKEILEHLRAALDYCAQQIWLGTSGHPRNANVYFPIARADSDETRFRSLMDLKMPGVAAASPDAFAALLGMQVFINRRNGWLTDLATLVNQAKHDHLEVASMPPTALTYERRADGTTIMVFAPGHSFRRPPTWWMIKGGLNSSDTKSESEAVFLQFSAISSEVSVFLDEAVVGVAGIIEQCRALVL